MRYRSRVGSVAAAVVLVAACATPNGPYEASVAAGLRTRLTADDAVAITRGYLDAQTPELAAPELHIPPHVRFVGAVAARDAWRLDGCIRAVPGDQPVWITKGEGDYLNLRPLAWSTPGSYLDQVDPDPIRLACQGPGPAGTIVIDDTTGSILGVFPEAPGAWHASVSPG